MSLLATSYRVVMASLLALFVPQKCPESPSNECTLRDNFTDLIPFNVAVLVVNFLTLGSMIALSVIEYHRENWCIEYLDFDEKQPITALVGQLEQHAQRKDELTRHTYRYYVAAWVAVGCNAVNFLVSAVLIYHYYYLDYKSITVLVSFVLLIADKLSTAFSVSRRSLHEFIVESAYRSGPTVYNVLDPDHLVVTSPSIEMNRQ